MLVRPTTGDTVDSWLQSNLISGSCLVISNNPYVGYQDSVVRTLLPNDFKIETVGNKCSLSVVIAVYLDNLVRWLYQEQKRLSENS